jgi:hypothetical protein
LLTRIGLLEVAPSVVQTAVIVDFLPARPCYSLFGNSYPLESSVWAGF